MCESHVDKLDVYSCQYGNEIETVLHKHLYLP